MRWTLRVICLIVVALAIVTIVARNRVADTKAALLGTPGANESDSGDPSPSEQSGEPSASDSAQDADAGVPYKTPLAKGLGQMIDSTSQALDGQADQLRDSLIQADEMLADVREQNRRAMREASRQVRLPGPRSPNIFLIVVDDLSVADLACYGSTTVSTPHIDRLADVGVRFTDFYAGPSVQQAHRSLRSGTGDKEAKNRVGATLWQAGYETILIGDTSRADVVGRSAESHGYEIWFGSGDKQLTPTSFPASLWSNGSQITVKANEDDKRQLTADQIYRNELDAFWRKRRGRHPFAVELITSVGASRDGAARSEHVQRLDETIGHVLNSLDQSGRRRNTAVILLGIGGQDDQAITGDNLRHGKHGMYEGICEHL